MPDFDYVSLFSGIGGLEHPNVAPKLICESDPACRRVLECRYPGVASVSDIRDLHEPPAVSYVTGGWPCQDLSSAGVLRGIQAARSGLFFEMLRVARIAGAHTIIGENVPNLLSINSGLDFKVVLDAFQEHGYPFVSWRVLNARAFRLPQERKRLFVVASRERERADALHAAVPASQRRPGTSMAAGFYWTAGQRSLCFSRGYVPALKIGATDNKGRAPVAVFTGALTRKLTPREFLLLQGFDERDVSGLAASTLLRMAGNAVPKPVGHFVIDAVARTLPPSGVRSGFGVIGESGTLESGLTWIVDHEPLPLATNLEEFLDDRAGEPLSAQAAAGLIVRCVRSGNPMPRELFDVLWTASEVRTGRLRASRANSFDALDSMKDAVAAYAARLQPIACYEGRREPDTDDVQDEGEVAA